MKVVVAPVLGGGLSTTEQATAIADGWAAARPGDEVTLVPLSDGGRGLLQVVATAEDTWVTTEVAGPHGHPLEAALLLRPDGSAVVEAAQAAGIERSPDGRRAPLLATSYGVGQLLDAARDVGADRLLVGLGDLASLDGGTGALNGLGLRLTVADGSGLKIGGDDLHRVRRVEPGWSSDWSGVEVQLLTDADAPTLAEAAAWYGPRVGASSEEVAALAAALATWSEVAERDLPGSGRPDEPGAGAGGGLAFGLQGALPAARRVHGVTVVAELVGFDAALVDADLVVTGEGHPLPTVADRHRLVRLAAAGVDDTSEADVAAAAEQLASSL